MPVSALTGCPDAPKYPRGLTHVVGGWFLDEGDPEHESRHIAVLGDSRAEDPNIFYGPAKWDGGFGPATARKLLFVKMAGYDEWATAVEKFEYGDGPDPGLASPWPGFVTVTDYGRQMGLGGLGGLQIVEKAGLLRLIRPIAGRHTFNGLSLASAAERLARSARELPFLFGR